MIDRSRRAAAPEAELATPWEDATVARAPESALRALSDDEERLVVFCCTLAGARSADLLDQVSPERAPALRQAADTFVELDRTARLATFSRLFAPAPSEHAVRRLVERLQPEPAWLAALVCRCVSPEVRDRLLDSPRLRDAWRLEHKPHPAMLQHARRFAARCLCG